jgi:SH3-like domain-containing protein
MQRGITNSRAFLLPWIVLLAVSWALAGCQELDTLKREIVKKAEGKILKKKNPFTPRDGITIRATSMYQTANPNSEVIRRVPAETPVYLMDKVGDWYRVRTRDGREGYLEQKVVGGQEIIQKTQELRRSIEGMSVQAEGVTKAKANFRLEPGRQHEVIEILPPDKKLEVYERVVTLQKSPSPAAVQRKGGGPVQAVEEPSNDDASDDMKKDVWYKVKIEDGRVGYIYTHNLKITPPEDIARAVPYMRMMAWKTINTTDDPDRGAMNNFLVAYAPIGKDPGCDYTRLYFMHWSAKQKRRSISWQTRVNGVLPISNYHFEGKPGFSIRYLHPTKKDKLILASFVVSGGSLRKVSEEEIPNPSEVH